MSSTTYILDGKPVTVSDKPWWIGWIFAEGSAVTINGTVYVNTLGDLCLLNHEFTHVRQQRAYSSMNAWLVRYLASKSFRTSQELEAYTVQCHEIGIKYGQKSTQYATFLDSVPDIVGVSQKQVTAIMADLWSKYPDKYIVEFAKK
jgi:hypothetical protein